MSTLSTHPRVRSLADQVYERLRVDIITGRLAPDVRIVELDVAQAVGTSQGPVREALQRLEREGLVRRHAHSATFVTGISLDEIHELFSVRSLIETFAVRRAARTIGDEQCRQLDAFVEEMRAAAMRDDLLALTESDLLFHRSLCLWSGSAGLLRAWDPLYTQIQRFVIQTYRDYFDQLIDVADAHLPIIAALRRCDAEEAAQLVEAHVLLIWSKIDAVQAVSAD